MLGIMKNQSSQVTKTKNVDNTIIGIIIDCCSIKFNNMSLGADGMVKGPSSKNPDQNNPEKYFSQNNKHVSIVIDNTLYYKDIRNKRYF